METTKLEYGRGRGNFRQLQEEAKKSELKIRSQGGPRRKKEGFICSKPLKKKLRATALKKMERVRFFLKLD